MKTFDGTPRKVLWKRLSVFLTQHHVTQHGLFQFEEAVDFAR